MPLKRSRSVAVPSDKDHNSKGHGNGGKQAQDVRITSVSPKEWAATLAMLGNMPRAHFSRRHRNNSHSDAPRDHRSRSTDHHQHKPRSNSDTNAGMDAPRRNSSGHSKKQSPGKERRRTSLPTSAQAALRSSSREVHVKALGDLQTAAARLPHPEVVYGAMIPEPDYSDDEREAGVTKQAALVTRNNQVNNASSPASKEEKSGAGSTRVDEKGLIVPKKLVNPCLESSEKKNLHKELLYNQKRGVNVLNQKSELQKAIEKHNDKKVLKEIQKEKQANLTPFQKALDERAQKIEQMEKAENKDPENEEKSACEFQKIHAKVRAKMEVQ